MRLAHPTKAMRQSALSDAFATACPTYLGVGENESTNASPSADDPGGRESEHVAKRMNTAWVLDDSGVIVGKCLSPSKA